MANSELSNCNLLPVEYIDPRFISGRYTRIGPCLQLSVGCGSGPGCERWESIPGSGALCAEGLETSEGKCYLFIYQHFPPWRFCEACSGCVRGKERVEAKAWVTTCLVAQQALPCLAFPTRVICHCCLFHSSLSPAFPRQGRHLAFLLGCYLSHRGCDKPSGGGLGGVEKGENMIKIWCMQNISNKKIIKRIPPPQANQTKVIHFPCQ